MAGGTKIGSVIEGGMTEGTKESLLVAGGTKVGSVIEGGVTEGTKEGLLVVVGFEGDT